MPVPDYQSLMAPTLNVLAGGPTYWGRFLASQPHPRREFHARILPWRNLTN